MGTRVGTGGGVVGKDGGGAVLIRRRELRVPSSVKRCFVQKSITESRCKKKKKSSTKNLSFFFFSFFSFLFFFPFLFSRRKKLSRKSARANQCDQMLRGTWNFHHALFLSFSIEKYIIYIYIFFITINFLFLDILSSRKMKRK